MNNQIRQTIRDELKLQRVSQRRVGQLLEMSQPNVNRLLSPDRGPSVPQNVGKLLDFLEIELIAVPRKRVNSEEKDDYQEGEWDK